MPRLATSDERMTHDSQLTTDDYRLRSPRREVEFPGNHGLFVGPEDAFDELHMHAEKPLERLREMDLEHAIAREILRGELRNRGVGHAARADARSAGRHPHVVLDGG